MRLVKPSSVVKPNVALQSLILEAVIHTTVESITGYEDRIALVDRVEHAFCRDARDYTFAEEARIEVLVKLSSQNPCSRVGRRIYLAEYRLVSLRAFLHSLIDFFNVDSQSPMVFLLALNVRSTVRNQPASQTLVEPHFLHFKVLSDSAIL